MPEETGAQPQAGGAPSSSPEDTGKPLEGQPTNTTPKADTIDALPEWAQKEIKALRTEAQNKGKRLKEIEDAQLTEAEKREARIKELESTNGELSTRLRQTEARSVVAEAGALYPDLVADKLPADLDLSDKKATDAALAEIREKYPAMFKAVHGSADGGAGTRGGGAAAGSDMNVMLRRAAGRG